MAVDTAIFSEFATKFRNQDPRVYEQFLRLLDAYATEVTDEIMVATPANIMVLQGRAQQMKKVFQMLSEFREPKPKPTP